MDVTATASILLVGGGTFAGTYLLAGGVKGASARNGPRGEPAVAGRQTVDIRTLLESSGLMRSIMRAGPVTRLVAQAQAERVRTTCVRQMPVLIDVVTLGLTAGLSFDASLDLYCERYDDELSSLFGKALMSWRIGAMTRSKALAVLAEESGVDAMSTFSSTVTQALEFGMPLAETLEGQAENMREAQRAQVEEEIERVPVKMLIPLGTLIMPAMLLSILGPLLGSTLSIG